MNLSSIYKNKGGGINMFFFKLSKKKSRSDRLRKINSELRSINQNRTLDHTQRMELKLKIIKEIKEMYPET